METGSLHVPGSAARCSRAAISETWPVALAFEHGLVSRIGRVRPSGFPRPRLVFATAGCAAKSVLPVLPLPETGPEVRFPERPNWLQASGRSLRVHKRDATLNRAQTVPRVLPDQGAPA